MARQYDNRFANVRWEHIDEDLGHLQDILSQAGFAPAHFRFDDAAVMRAEFDDFPEFYALRLVWLSWEEGQTDIAAVPIYIWANSHKVVSFSAQPLAAIDQVRDKLADNPEWVASSSRLVYYLLDEILGGLFPFLDGLNDRIAVLEEVVVRVRRPGRMEQRIFRLKRELLKARHVLASMRDAVSQLVRYWTTHNDFDSFYYMELYDHMIRHFDTVDTYRELVNSVLDLHLSTVSNRLNEIVKTLTLVTTALLPASLVAGLYGMNFDYVPLTHYRWGFFVVLGVIATVSLLVFSLFRRRDWV